MRCQCCEAPNSDDSLYCQYCGTKLERRQKTENFQTTESRIMHSESANNSNTYYYHSNNYFNNQQGCNRTPNKKKSSKKVFIIALASLITAIVIMFCVIIIPISKYIDIEIDLSNGYGTNDNSTINEDTEQNEKNDKDDEVEKSDETKNDKDKNDETKNDKDKNDETKNDDINKEKKTKKTKTTILHDNHYIRYIGSEDEAYELLEKDSNSQKKDNPIEITNLEEEIISKCGIDSVNLKEMDEEFVQDLYKALMWIEKEYPNELEELNQLTLINGPYGGYIAYYTPVNILANNKYDTMPYVIRKEIALNTIYYLNRDFFEKETKSSASVGHFPKNANSVSPLIHEIGHYLSYKALLKEHGLNDSFYIDSNNEYGILIEILNDFSVGDFSHKIIKEAYENYCKTNPYISELDFRSTISKYALAKDAYNKYIYDETIAEAFHDYYLNGKNAAKASIEIVKVLNKYLKK